MTQKILITGGAGFVGKHLVQKLQERGTKVTILDNLSTGSTENIPSSGISFFKGDIRSKDDLRKAAADVDAIVHLAATVSVPVCENDPVSCTENNVTGTSNVFEVAKEFGIRKVVYASSAAVYGNLDSSSIKEDSATVPVSQYGKSKLENEKTALSFSGSIDSVGLRFFNIYGPGLKMENAYPSVLVSFFKRIKNSEPLTVFGDGKQTRDFVHVSDIVQAIIKSLELRTPGSHIFNIGTGIETSILSLAEQIKNIRNDVRISFMPIRDFDIQKSCSDISKIQNETNYRPTRFVMDDIEELLKIYTN